MHSTCFSFPSSWFALLTLFLFIAIWFFFSFAAFRYRSWFGSSTQIFRPTITVGDVPASQVPKLFLKLQLATNSNDTPSVGVATRYFYTEHSRVFIAFPILPFQWWIIAQVSTTTPTMPVSLSIAEVTKPAVIFHSWLLWFWWHAAPSFLLDWLRENSLPRIPSIALLAAINMFGVGLESGTPRPGVMPIVPIAAGKRIAGVSGSLRLDRRVVGSSGAWKQFAISNVSFSFAVVSSPLLMAINLSYITFTDCFIVDLWLAALRQWYRVG